MRKTRWLIILMAMVVLLGAALSGCGRSSGDPSGNGNVDPGNGEQDPGGSAQDPGGSDPGKEIDMEVFYGRDFTGSESFKFEWWQKVDGEESTGWITVKVSETDGEYTVDYHGALGDEEYSNTETLGLEHGGITFTLRLLVADTVDYYLYSRLWREAVWAVLENFEGSDFDRVGSKSSFLDYEAEAVGYNTYAGHEGLTLTMKKSGRLIYEVCINPDIPVNLYSYTYDTFDNNEYRVELVEYSD